MTLYVKLVRALGLAFAATTLWTLDTPAWASVFTTFDVTPNVISPGGSATLDLTISVSPDGSDFNASLQSGTVTLSDGLGDSQVFSISPGLASENFSYTFAYPNSGNFIPSFSVTANYSEQYSYQQEVQTGGGFYYTCGPFGEQCWQPPTYTLETFYNTTGGSQNLSGSGDVSVVTPLPAAFPLFATGLSGLGLLGWRRKRKAQAVA